MHAVFRIGQIKPIDENDNRVWQVELKLTGDHDPQLRELTNSVREETDASTGWSRLVRLTIKVAQYDKAHQLCEMLLPSTTDEP
jgi:hypothetical protein